MTNQEIEKINKEIERLKKKLKKKNKQLRKLKMSNLFLESLFEGISEEIMVLDNEYNVIDVNEAFLKRHGLIKKSVIGQKCFSIKKSGVSPCFQEMALCPVEKARTSGEIIETTHSSKDEKGDVREFVFIIYPLKPHGEDVEYFLEIARDVTEERQIKGRLLQSERLAAVGTAVAHVVHEIKNPLMIIGGLSNQIKMNLEKEKDLNKIDIILDEVLRLERLVADLGDFTKKYRLVKRPSDINSVIRDVIQIMTGASSQEKYTFKETLSSQVKTINCDPDKLKQVFINIIYNGLEAMQDGGEISVSTNKTKNGIEIRINDQGTGIPEENLKNIFEPFYTTREKGSGLGLSISYKLIEAHEGDIWAVSSPGSKGTTFVIRLPDD